MRRNWIIINEAAEKFNLPHETMKQRCVNRRLAMKTSFVNRTYTKKTKVSFVDADELDKMMEKWRREYGDSNGS